MAIALVLSGCAGAPPSPGAGAGTPGAPATMASPGITAGPVVAPTIPQATVRFALFPCCPDNNISFVPIRKGFFEDMGITLNPPDAIKLTDSSQNLPTMQRGDADIIMWYIPGNMQTLDSFGFDIVPILFMDIYLGNTILKSPDNPAKTAEEFLAEGMSWQEAAAAAVKQLKGAVVWTPAAAAVLPQQPAVFLSYGGVTYDDLTFSFLEDARIAQQAAAGRIDWALPASAGIVVQLMNNGWEPVIDANMVFEHDQGSDQRNALIKLVGSTGLSAQRSFVDQNRETALRFLSAMYRGFDFTFDPATQREALGIVAENVNASGGTTLTPDDIKAVYEVIDPFFPFEVQGKQLWEEGAPYHVKSGLEVQLQDLIDRGTLPDREYDVDAWVVGEDLYREMLAQQKQADELFAQAEAQELSADGETLVERAHELYEWYDFLDAVRFLEAALAR